MKNIIRLFLILLTVFFFSSLPTLANEKFVIMTEELPPFNYQENGQVKGISVDIVLAVLKKSGYQVHAENIHVYPWVRAYKDVQNKPNTILFSMGRTKERENLFKWVGPIAKLEIGVIGDKSILINEISDFDKYRIGTVRDSAPEQLLVKKGLSIDTFERTSYPLNNIKKIRSNRIDLFAFNIPTTKYLMKTNGMDTSRFKSVYTLKEIELFMAFHHSTDQIVIDKIQAELNKLKASSIYNEIISNYM